MPFGLPVAFALLAQAAAASPAPGSDARYGPVPAVAPPPKVSTEPTRECVNQNQNPNGNEIIVCAIKPEGYRLPPDIVEARRLKKQGITGSPHNPHESYADRSCANVGPMGCRGTPAINLLAVAATAAQISQRLAKGQEIGSIFETQKSSTDYQLFQMAKKSREEKEAAAEVKAVKEKAQAAIKASKPAAPPQPE